MSSSKKVFKVEGMTCQHCEKAIEKGLKKEGVIKSEASHMAKTARVEFDPEKISEKEIRQCIQDAGYEVSGVEEDVGKNRKGIEIIQVVGISIALLGIYFLVQKTIGFNFIPQVDSSMGYGMIFVVGLITSLHCIAMCGGIAVSQCVNNEGNKYASSILYNAGRIVSYTVIGGIVGALGSVFNFSPSIKGGIAFAAGVLMVLVGLRMAGLFSFVKKIKIPGSGILSGIIPQKTILKAYRFGPFAIGLLNGLMPCAPLQGMQLYALGSGSAFNGALSMFFFSLGTVPLLFGIGTAASLFSRKFSGWLIRASAILVIFLGIVMVNRGLSLTGNGVTVPKAGGNIAALKGNYQEVTMKVGPNNFEPIVVQKGIPVKWIIKADSADLNGCNNGILVPEYGINKQLAPGETVVEFTPDKSGKIGYSCWMGMIRDTITVVDDISKVNGSTLNNGNANVPQPPAGGCCNTGNASGNLNEQDIYVPPVINNTQTATITVDQNGYHPAVLILQKGASFKIKFDVKQLTSCNRAVIFPEYGGGLDFSKNQLETPNLKAAQDFHFSCWMGMLKGYGAVVDNVKNINKAEIIAKANLPSSGVGSGGCCGNRQ